MKKQTYELIHDSIANIIYQKASSDMQQRRKVEKFVREKIELEKSQNFKPSKNDIEYITPWLGIINLTQEEFHFVKKNSKRIKRRRWILISTVSFVFLFLLTTTLLTIWTLGQKKIAEKEQIKATLSKERAEALKDSAMMNEKRALEISKTLQSLIDEQGRLS